MRFKHNQPGLCEEASPRSLKLTWMLPLLVMIVAVGSSSSCWAIQRHTLSPQEEVINSHPSGATHQETASPGTDSHGLPLKLVATAAQQQSPGHGPQNSHGAAAAPQQGHGNQPSAAPSQGHGPGQAGGAVQPVPSAPGHGGTAEQHAPKEHGKEEAHDAHGPALPQISPIPGVTFVDTMVKLLEDELNARTFGWRPNDIIIGRVTDNVNNYQLGVLEALRFTTLRLKDSLTRMGDADTYDPDLEQASNSLMNRATLFWFPSAERAYGEAADHLRKFSNKLQRGQRNFYYRKDNLQALLNSYKDLLGNVNRSLIVSDVSWFQTDDYFYYAKGVAHVYYEILRVVRVGFEAPLSSTLHARDIMDEVIHELHKVEEMEPWIVLDSDPDSIFANHRANLNAPLSESAHLLGILSQF